ncbi:unnamed protein product [Notodromas monacha]|uniref:Cytochrome b-c1 complex subunit 8 n=1 Tax=Notodromas monacha TaxID=399045 RepID=A0A7R9GJR1_9CRUS|nr:unnamed protein product [Notodromas monacha]CAG0923935.1 unnamed protein product [Notodromas monacha]
MGLHFGSLGVKVRGLVTVRLSPYEQKPFAGAVSKGFPNMIRRVQEEVLFVVPPFVIGYLIYAWGEAAYQNNLRKQDGSFECAIAAAGKAEE